MSVRSMSLLGMLVLVVTFPTACSRDAGRAVLGPKLGVESSGTSGVVPKGAESELRVRLEFDPEDFVAKIDNPFFPLVPGTVFRYAGDTSDGHETDEVTVTREKKRILGVAATVVRDIVHVDGALAEDTFDYYAQDEDGNVWYLGEDTKEYENGVVVSTLGTWLAGVNGARPGIIMLAHPRVGNSYQQEFAAGVAEDRARVTSLSKTVTVPYGTFTRCLRTLESTPLEPGVTSNKLYARGVGEVLEVAQQGAERIELVSVSKP